MATKTINFPIEVDVTCVNRTWFSHTKRANQKAYAIGFYQRSQPCKAIIKVLENNKPETIEKIIIENVPKGCIVYCEEKILPESIKEIYEVHELPEGAHVQGDLHINNVKSIWRQLKRLIKEEHISVTFKHLQSYCNEVAWRASNAHLTPSERFATLLQNSVGRLKYSDLIQRGKEGSAK